MPEIKRDMAEAIELVKLYQAIGDRAEGAYEEALEAWAYDDQDGQRAAMIRYNGFNRTSNRLAAEIRAMNLPGFSFMRIEDWLRENA